MTTRRQVLAGLVAAGLLAGRTRAAGTATLRAGDQKGGTCGLNHGVWSTSIRVAPLSFPRQPAVQRLPKMPSHDCVTFCYGLE